MPLIAIPPITKGMSLAGVSVPGACLELIDCFVDRYGEIRKRGGKLQISDTFPSNTQYCLGHAHNNEALVAHPSSEVQRLAMFNISVSPFRVLASTDTLTWTSLPARVDSAGATPTKFKLGSCAGLLGNHAQIFPFGSEILAVSNDGAVGQIYAPVRWSGSRKSSYRTGTVSVTSGSTTVAGSGTSWSANVEPGMYLYIDNGSDSPALNERMFRITKVTSNTSLEIDRAPDQTRSGASYAINSVGAISAPDNVFHDGTSAVNYPVADVMCAHQDRIIVGATLEPDGNTYKRHESRIRWSALPHEANGKFVGMDQWYSADFADIYPNGGAIIGMVSTQAGLIIAKERMVCIARGGLGTDGTDAGLSAEVVIDRVTNPIIESTPMGVAIACREGVWMFDGSGMKDLLEDTLGHAWRDMALYDIPGSSTGHVSMSSTNTRLIFSRDNLSLVYDYLKKHWYVQNSPTTLGNIDNVDGQELAFTSSGTLMELDWSGDYSTAGLALSSDDDSTSRPRMRITYAPVPLGVNAISQGRVNNVYVNGYIHDAATDNPTLTVGLMYGRYWDLSATGGGPTATLEDDVVIGTIADGTFDETYRVPVDGAKSRSHVVVYIQQNNVSDDARIYDVFLDVAPTNNIATE